jgi:heptosyltransferase-1
MTSILLVKTSSLGDVVHNLPVVSDLCRALPDAAIDWVVEENFAAIPRAHAAVRRVLPVAIRRWRRTPWRPLLWNEMGAFARALRAERYDAVIDSQGLLKSALIARAARGTRYGLDWKSSREPLSMFYDRTFSVSRMQHAVERNRALAAGALQYVAGNEIDYGIRAGPSRFPWLARNRYAVMIHSTSASAKLWPEVRWIEVGSHFAQSGVACVWPWGSAAERERSMALAARVSGSIVPPQLMLEDAMALLGRAEAVIGVDTGLTHLAAALDAVTVGIFTATDPALTGIYGSPHATNIGGVGAPPTAREVVNALDGFAL